MPDDPHTPHEWQQAADAADFLLLLDAAQQYGLITGGEGVHVDRCTQILERAADRGIFPTPPDRRRAWVAWWLQYERLALGVSQQTIADRAGLPQPIISLIERGRSTVDQARWERLAAAIEYIRQERLSES